ncbi:MAG: hypothetical protein OJF49_004117 [Ktedonobacterales bacterium]|nr:MAG: hypothetical protein OJF49_004117 [Ktedonobacterales bacterium]
MCYTRCVLRHSGSPEQTVQTARFQLNIGGSWRETSPG